MKHLYTCIFTIFLMSCVNKTSKVKVVEPQNENLKPNIIVILTDDQGYDDVGFNGCKDILTPNIDRIANNGVMFTNGYVSYSVCGPSRAGLITGRYQDRFGFSRNPLFAPNDPNMGLPLSEENLGEVLSKVGYKNMAIGKWHLGAHKSLRPLKRGFDEFYGFLSGGHNYFPEKLIRNNLSEVTSQFDAYNTKLLSNDSRVEEKEYLTDAFSREAVKFVERNHKTPFFMYLAYNAPHGPLQAPEKYLNRFNHITNKKRKTYAAMVSAVDDGVGELLDKLEELNIDDNTLIFFLSDNGGPEDHNASDNGVLRDGKGSLHEGGIRVPFALQWPGTIPKGLVYNKPIISLDIFATVASLADVTPKNQLDGVNLMPYLLNKNKEYPHEQLFWRMYDGKSLAIRSKNIKLVKYKSSKKRLYNLENDISETTALNDSILNEKLLKAHIEWNYKNLNPVFLGLKQDKQYDSLHVDRWNNIKKY